MKAEKSGWKTDGGRIFAALWIAVSTLTVPVWAGTAGTDDGIAGIEVGCDDRGTGCRAVFADIELPGDVRGQLRVSFADATLLGASTLEIFAQLVDPRDPQLTDRLPRDTFIPSDFPVLVRIEPRRDGLFSYRRNWTLELVTENLEFSSRTPYRLFRAPTGGAFEDISASLGSGSFRVRGAAASFSEFVIAADLRPVERVAGRKFALLEARLSANAEDIGAVADDLEQFAGQARQAVEEGNLPAAVRNLESFIGLVEASSGTEIPDDSSPGDGVVGIAAQLLSSALTLRHSLFLGLQSAQGGMSGFSRRFNAGGHSVVVKLDFEEAFVVDPEILDITPQLIDVNDPALVARLPEGVRVPEEFPVLIRINPRPGEEPAFSGIFEIEIQTDSLDFLGGTPLRLFKAPDGGAFEMP